MTNEQIATRAVENAETAAQLEIKDSELRASLVRNFVQELDRMARPETGLLECECPSCGYEFRRSGPILSQTRGTP